MKTDRLAVFGFDSVVTAALRFLPAALADRSAGDGVNRFHNHIGIKG